jgi:hypothetical protein
LILKNTLFVNYQIQPAQKEQNYVLMRQFRVFIELGDFFINLDLYFLKWGLG